MAEKSVNSGNMDAGGAPLNLAPAHAIRLTGAAHDGIAMLSHLFALAAGSRGYHLFSIPEYPAEIRSHANTLAGVHTSSLAFAPYSEPIDDRTSFLLAMNPAGLKLHENCLEKDGILLANSDSFGPEELACAGHGTAHKPCDQPYPGGRKRRPPLLQGSGSLQKSFRAWDDAVVLLNPDRPGVAMAKTKVFREPIHP
jgi:hypothetical protein